MRRGAGGGALYSWRTGVLVPYFKDYGEGGVLYIVGAQGSLSHFLRIKIIDPVFLGVSWEKERCVTNWVLFRGNLSL